MELIIQTLVKPFIESIPPFCLYYLPMVQCRGDTWCLSRSSSQRSQESVCMVFKFIFPQPMLNLTFVTCHFLVVQLCKAVASCAFDQLFSPSVRTHGQILCLPMCTCVHFPHIIIGSVLHMKHQSRSPQTKFEEWVWINFQQEEADLTINCHSLKSNHCCYQNVPWLGIGVEEGGLGGPTPQIFECWYISTSNSLQHTLYACA